MDARSSGERGGKQKVHWAAQLIGLMTDDSLMTAACDCFCFPPCARALCNSGSHRQQSVVSLTQSCIVCILLDRRSRAFQLMGLISPGWGSKDFEAQIVSSG